MKIMMHMHKKNNNKLLKRIIGITATVIILVAAVVAIIFFHLMRKPQIKLVEAMVNTINSSRESEMNQQYGTFDMGMNMINGSQSFSFEDNSDHSVDISLKRSASNHNFLAEAGVDDKTFKLYANKRTSLIYIDDMAIRIQYADNLITNMSNSQVVSLLGIDSDTVYSFGTAYENCMRMAANNYADINGDDIQTDIIQKTLKYFFNMEGTSEGKQTVVTGDSTQDCKVYSVIFNVDDFYSYLDDCFGTHDIDFQEVYDMLDKYIPEIDTIDNTAELVHDIKQFVDEMLDGRDITLYFAVNSKNELVKLYADHVSDRDMSMSLTFYGDKYTAQSYEFTVTDNSDNHLVIKKRDVSSDGETGVVFDVDISAADLMDSVKPVSISASVELRLSGSDAVLGIQVGDAVFRKNADITGYKKGESIDLAWSGDSDGSMHIGCDPGAIDKPEYRDSLDIFDTDVISAYKFIKEIMNR